MSDLTASIHGATIPVTLPQGIEPFMFSSMLKGYKPFSEWCKNVDKNLEIRGLTIQGVDYFGAHIGFLKFSAEAYSRIHGERVPGIVFMRGGSVAVLLVLTDEQTKEEYVVLTEQARVPVGQASFVEIPAGMMDNEGDVTGVAIREVAEETGIEVKRTELQSLGSYYSSPGGSDELISLFYLERSVPSTFIKSLESKLTGVDAHERITVRIRKLEEAVKSMNDGKSLLAILLYRSLKKGVR